MTGFELWLNTPDDENEAVRQFGPGRKKVNESIGNNRLEDSKKVFLLNVFWEFPRPFIYRKCLFYP